MKNDQKAVLQIKATMRKTAEILTVILPMLLLVASVSSCRKDLVPTGDIPISFDSSVETKSLVESIIDMDKFKVYGYYTTDDGITSNTAFNGVDVERQGSSWIYSPARYWANDGEYSFAAFYPSSSNVTITNPDIDQDGKFKELSFEYEKNSFQDDFMLATNSITSEYAVGSGCAVELPFQHILSNLKVNIGLAASVQDGTYITLRSVALNGLKRSATYTVGSGWSDLSSTALQFSGTIDNIVLYKSGGETYNYNNGSPELLEDGVIKPTGDDGLTVIPIDLTDKANTVTLRLVCEVSSDGSSFTQKIIERTFVATAEVDSWDEGKTYTYKALLDVDYNISFSEPTVTDWVDEQATGSVIIK